MFAEIVNLLPPRKKQPRLAASAFRLPARDLGLCGLEPQTSSLSNPGLRNLTVAAVWIRLLVCFGPILVRLGGIRRGGPAGHLQVGRRQVRIALRDNEGTVAHDLLHRVRVHRMTRREAQVWRRSCQTGSTIWFAASTGLPSLLFPEPSRTMCRSGWGGRGKTGAPQSGQAEHVSQFGDG